MSCQTKTRFFAAVVAVFLTACDPCENTIVQELVSPDGKKKVVVFERSCGATTGFSTQVSILPASAHARDAGNAFTADTNHGAAPAAEWGGPPVEVKWLTSRDVSLRHHPNARAFTREDVVDGIRIKYGNGQPPN